MSAQTLFLAEMCSGQQGIMQRKANAPCAPVVQLFLTESLLLVAVPDLSHTVSFGAALWHPTADGQWQQ